MSANLVSNPNMLESTDQYYGVYTSDCVARSVKGSINDPSHYFYLGGCDYPDYPNGLPVGVEQSSFEYAGGQWSSESVDNDPTVSKSILIDAADPLANFGTIGREHNPQYGGSGGITQVVYIGQSEAKAFRFSAYCKCEDVVGNAKVLFDVVGYEGEGAGTYLTFVSGTHGFAKLSELKTFNFPVKYAFLHFSVQAMSSGKAWFAKPVLEEVDMDLIVPDENERILNPIFNHTSNEIDTVAWHTTNTERFEDIDLIYLNPYLGGILRVTQGGVLRQNAVIVEDINLGSITVKFTARSLGTTTTRLTVKGRGRHRNLMFSKSKEFTISSDGNWEEMRLTVLCPPATEKMDVIFENVSGAELLVCNASAIGDSTLPPNVSASTSIVDTVTRINLDTLPSFDDTYVNQLPSVMSTKLLELTGDDYNGTIYLTNGKIGKFVPYKEFSDFTLMINRPLGKITDTTYSLNPWNNNIIELKTQDEFIREYVPAPHINETEDIIYSTGGSIKGGERRYYCVTSYNYEGESTKSNDVRYLIPDDTDTNKLYLEITPVIGAIGYNIYMSKVYDNSLRSTELEVYGADYVVWGENALLDTIGAEQLRDNGYFYWDYGGRDIYMEAGTPSMTINTAKHWYANNDTYRVHISSTYFKNEDLIAGCKVPTYTIQAFKFLPHSGKFYFATNQGVFESDDIFQTKLHLIESYTDRVAMCYGRDGMKYSNAVDKGYHYEFFKEYLFSYSTGVLRIYDSGTLTGTYTLSVSGASFNGFAKFYNYFITHDRNSGSFVVFDQQCNVMDIVPFVLTEFVMWDLSGSLLSVLLSDGTIKQLGVLADKYYAKFDSIDTAYNGLHYPALCHPRLPDEPEDLDENEILQNGTFNVWNGTGLTPDSFTLYMIALT